MAWTRNVYDQVNTRISPRIWQRLIIAFLLFVIPILLFGYIAHQVFEGDTTAIDSRVLLGIHHRSTPVLNDIVVATTDIGGVIGVISIGLIILAFYAWRRRWMACLQIVAGIGGAGALNFILKVIFERNRPDLWHHIVFESGYSFPSGHAMLSSALAFTVVALAWHTKWRYPAIASGAIYMFYIAFTRLYLGVHYPTDILAGWCVSLAWVILVGLTLGAVTIPVRRILHKA